MRTWILEADIYRLEKALFDAAPAERVKLQHHLRRAKAQLVASMLPQRAAQ